MRRIGMAEHLAGIIDLRARKPNGARHPLLC